MEKSNYSLPNNNEQQVNQKISFFGRTIKIFFIAYCLWIVLSVMISFKNAHMVAAYFIDLPAGLKNLPPFVMSIAYLDLFIPAVLLVFLYSFYILAFVIRNGSGKIGRVYNDVQLQMKTVDPK